MEVFTWAAAVILGGVVWADRLKSLWDKIELVKSRWTLINECSELLGYHSDLQEKWQTLQKKIATLSSQEEDINTQLVSSELRSGNKRKREVENWLRNVERKKNDVQSINQRFGDKLDLFCSRLRNDIIRSMEEVEELLAKGDFSNGLLLDVHRNGGEALLSTKLSGQAETYLERVLELLANDEVLSIGVHGITGVGKTNILTHVHNQILDGMTAFDHVYFITASQDSSIEKMQNDIAKEVGIDLSNEGDEKRRASRLFQSLSKKGKSVLIIDDLRKHFELNEVGIPVQVNRCKLIISTRSSNVRRMMGCDETINVEPLPKEDARTLFLKTLGSKNVLSQEVEAIANLIIKECDGLPRRIIELAKRMRGVDDVSEWRNTLNDEKECRGNLESLGDNF